MEEIEKILKKFAEGKVNLGQVVETFRKEGFKSVNFMGGGEGEDYTNLLFKPHWGFVFLDVSWGGETSLTIRNTGDFKEISGFLDGVII